MPEMSRLTVAVVDRPCYVSPEAPATLGTAIAEMIAAAANDGSAVALADPVRI